MFCTRNNSNIQCYGELVLIPTIVIGRKHEYSETGQELFKYGIDCNLYYIHIDFLAWQLYFEIKRKVKEK